MLYYVFIKRRELARWYNPVIERQDGLMATVTAGATPTIREEDSYYEHVIAGNLTMKEAEFVKRKCYDRDLENAEIKEMQPANIKKVKQRLRRIKQTMGQTIEAYYMKGQCKKCMEKTQLYNVFSNSKLLVSLCDNCLYKRWKRDTFTAEQMADKKLVKYHLGMKIEDDRTPDHIIPAPHANNVEQY